MLLACGYMLNMPSLLKAGNGLGFVVALLSCEFPDVLKCENITDTD